jgi:hypothetical protein
MLLLHIVILLVKSNALSLCACVHMEETQVHKWPATDTHESTCVCDHMKMEKTSPY